MERHVLPSSRQIMPGVKLEVSTLGGYSVLYHGEYIGWIHASVGDQWNAYLRHPNPGVAGEPLGKFNQLEAVRQILEAAMTR